MAQNIDSSLVLRLEATLTKFENQMAKARQAGTQTATTVENRFDTMGKRIATSSANAGNALTRVMNISGRGRFVLQNTAAQFGDIAVQLESGTAASRVMTQQLPQLLGGFGALGGALGIVAPLLGTVAAVGIPLAAMFLTVGAGADDASEDVKTFNDRIDDVEASLGRAEAAMTAASSGGVEDLRKKYGEVTSSVVELADALSDIEMRAVRLDLNSLMDGLFDQSYEDQIGDIFGSVGQALVGATQDQIDDAQRMIDQTQASIDARQTSGVFVSQTELDNLELMRQEIAVLNGDLANAGSLASEIRLPQELLTDISNFETNMRDAVAAGDFAGAKSAIEDMRGALVSAGLTVEDDIFRRMVEVEDVVREAANRFADAESNANGVAGAAGGIAPVVGDAADEAARLNGNLAGALSRLAGVAQGIASANRQAAASAQRRIDFAGDPVGLAGAETRANFNEQTGAAAYELIRSGNTGAVSELATTADRLEEGARAAAELEQQAKDAEAAAAAAVKAANGAASGGGGASSSGGRSSGDKGSMFDSADRQVEALQRQIEMLGKSRAEVAELTTRYALLDEAKRRDINVTDELSAQINAEAAEVGQLTRQYEDASARMAGMEDLQNDFKSSVIDAAMGGADAMDAFKDSIKRASLEYALFGTGSFTGGAGGGGGLLGGLVGGVGSMFAGFFDGGGHIPSGKVGIAGENGAEFVRGPAYVTSTADTAKLLGANGGTENVHVTFGFDADSNGNILPFVVGISRQTTASGIAQNNKTVPAMVSSGQERGL